MAATEGKRRAAAAVTSRGDHGLLDQVIGATRQTERDRAEELIKAP